MQAAPLPQVEAEMEKRTRLALERATVTHRELPYHRELTRLLRRTADGQLADASRERISRVGLKFEFGSRTESSIMVPDCWASCSAAVERRVQRRTAASNPVLGYCSTNRARNSNAHGKRYAATERHATRHLLLLRHHHHLQFSEYASFSLTDCLFPSTLVIH